MKLLLLLLVNVARRNVNTASVRSSLTRRQDLAIDYVFFYCPLWKDGSLFDSSSKNASNDEPQPSSDAGKKDDEGVNKESEIDDQERPKNSTQDVNTDRPITTAPLEATHADFFGDETKMDVKSAFLYGTIEEEVYVCQPPGFEDPEFPNKVYKVEKALYGLHQAPRAWYETLSTYLLENGFRRGTIDKTLFIKKDKDDILFVQVYVDDIIFGSTKKSLCTEFEHMMHKRFQMSSMGEITFFLGLQVKQKDDGIFISRDKYVADILKNFDFATMKTESTPMETNKALLKDEEAADVDVHLYRSMIGSLMYLTASRPDIVFVVYACARDSPFDLEAFSDSDYVGASLDRKSTTRGCQFLGRRLILWQCKKQTIVVNSTTEAEYVAAATYYGQVLWIQNQLLDYGYNFMNIKIFIDNESTIYIVKNLVFHLKTKHIKIRHHFIRDSYEKRLIQVIKIHTDHNSSRPIPLLIDETVIKEWEDRMKRVATTASSLEAERDSGSGPRCQDTILGVQKLKFDLRLHLNKSYDPLLSRVNTFGSGEDNMKLKELMEFCIKMFVRALDL
ncbi:putative ribonuclease H-like domain-containing protein [Tanacetum coccineum]